MLNPQIASDVLCQYSLARPSICSDLLSKTSVPVARTQDAFLSFAFFQRKVRLHTTTDALAAIQVKRLQAFKTTRAIVEQRQSRLIHGRIACRR